MKWRATGKHTVAAHTAVNSTTVCILWIVYKCNRLTQQIHWDTFMVRSSDLSENISLFILVHTEFFSWTFSKWDIRFSWNFFLNDFHVITDNRAGPSNLGNVISQILLCKQITPDFNQEELCSITKDSQEIAKLLSDMQEYTPNQETYLGTFEISSQWMDL